MQSVWMMGAERDAGRYPPLSGSLEVDTVVVGGGITGVATAWRLSEAGQRVAVLEAHAMGSGSTGGSTGNLYGTVSSGLAAMRAHWPAEVVRQMVALRLQAVDWLEKLVAAQAIDCGFARRALHTGVAGEDAASLQEEFDAASEAGLEPRWIDAQALPLGTTRAFRIEHQAQFNPYACVRGLADALARRGVLIHERSPVVEIDADQGCVVTAHGRVQARHIVLATHTPPGMNLVQAEMPVYRECGIAAALERGPCPEGIFWVRDASRSVRSYHGADRDYLIVVGEMHKPGHEEASQYDALRRYALEHFPVAEFTHAWSAQQYRSADALPYIGRSGDDNVFIATGFNADGLTWGVAAARIISDLVRGEESAAGEQLSPRRFTPVKSAKAWVAESKVVFDHRVKHRLSGKHGEDLSALEAGEGHQVEIDGKRCAAYRSPQGELSVVSATCTHMGCQVHWNPVATSWDCPCHGSRFTPAGEVIEGPALHPLKRIDLPRQE